MLEKIGVLNLNTPDLHGSFAGMFGGGSKASDDDSSLQQQAKVVTGSVSRNMTGGKIRNFAG